MSRPTLQKHRQLRSGAVVTEFALTLPLILMFFFAAFEVCRFSMISHTIENAAYEGARCGVIPGATSDQVRREAAGILEAVGIRQADIRVTPSNILPTTDSITVDIRVPFAENSFAPPQFFQGATISRSLTMTREGY